MSLPVNGFLQPVEIVVASTLPRNGYIQPVEVVAGVGVVTGSGAAGQVAYWDGATSITGNAGMTYVAGSNALTVTGFLNVGTTTDAVAAGDFAVGLTASHRAFYDQSAATLKLHSEAASNIFIMNSSTVQVRDFRFNTGDSLRWILRCDNTAESGSDVGSDLRIIRRSDAGADLGVAIFVKRSSGFTSIGNSGSPLQQLDVIGGLAANGTIATATGSSAVVLGKANAIPTNEVPAHILWADSGTGLAAGSLALVARSSAATSIAFYTGSTSPALRWQISSDGHLIAGLTNSYDIGATAGATCPRSIYAGTSFLAPVGSGSALPYAFASATTSGFWYEAALPGIHTVVGGVGRQVSSTAGTVLPSSLALAWCNQVNTLTAFTIDLNISRVSAGIGKVTNGANACDWRVHGNATLFTSVAHNGTDCLISSPNAASGRLIIGTGGDTNVIFLRGGGTAWTLTSLGMVSASNLRFSHGTSALATTATEGYMFMQSCAGDPTGVPASIPTGQKAWQYNSTAKTLWLYDGAWVKAKVAGVDVVFA